MRPFSKFAIYVALAGALVLLFARFPQASQKTEAPQQPGTLEQSAAPVEPQTLQVPGPVAGARATESRPAGLPRTDPAPAKIPAIRGLNNYGWVQLPRGTQVDLVGRSGRELWVRWDGTVVKIDSKHAASGAVILRRPITARASRG